jgi:hypothetical protein
MMMGKDSYKNGGIQCQNSRKVLLRSREEEEENKKEGSTEQERGKRK